MARKEFPRQGAWGKLADGSVGVINRIEGNVAEFHIADAKGETISVIGRVERDKKGEEHLVEGVPLELIKQAKHMDIPAPRRPKKAVADRFGYK